VCKTHINAGLAALEGDLKLCSLFRAAVEQYEMAQKDYSEPTQTRQLTNLPLLVADRVLDHALATKDLPRQPASTNAPVQGTSSCIAAIDTIVQLLLKKAELCALRATARCTDDRIKLERLHGLCDKALLTYQVAVNNQYMIAAWLLAARRDKSYHQQLEWHGAQVKGCESVFTKLLSFWPIHSRRHSRCSLPAKHRTLCRALQKRIRCTSIPHRTENTGEVVYQRSG
jgi:hypothetical protein